MKIELQRSGGFAGIRVPPVVVDTDSLSPQQRESIERAIQESNFFALPARPADPPGGADRFQYQLKIANEGREHVVSVSEGSEGALKPLLEQVRSVSKK